MKTSKPLAALMAIRYRARLGTTYLVIGLSISAGIFPRLTSHAGATTQAAGSLDTSFGTNGLVTTNLGADSLSEAVVQQSDGKLVVAGLSATTGSNPSPKGSRVARYNADGSLDSSFGTAGLATLSPSGFAITAMAIQSDGKLVLAGATLTGSLFGGTYAFTLARLNTDGSVDSTFGSAGQVTNIFADGTLAVALAVAMQSDGRILAAGVSGTLTSPAFSLARLNADGSLDASFGSGGTTTISAANSVAFSVVVQPDGKIVAGGAAGVNIAATELTGVVTGQFILARLNSDGTVDSAFGTEGVVQSSLGTSSAVSQISLQPDNKIVAGGVALSGQENFAIARYNSDGSLDTAFGTGGKVLTNFDSKNDVATSLSVQADGKIVASGVTFPGFFAAAADIRPASRISPSGFGLLLFGFIDIPGAEIAVARYNADGSLDAGFGTNGTATAGTGMGSGGLGAIIQQDGKVVVVGSTSPNGTDFNFVLARFEAGPIAGDFGLAPSVGLQTVSAGGSVTFTINLQSVAGTTPPSGSVALTTWAAAADGVTAEISEASVDLGQSVTLTVNTAANTPSGTYTITIEGTSGTVSHSSTVALKVQPPGPDFAISFGSPTINGSRPSKVTVTVIITKTGGFTGTVSVNAPANLPPGVSVKGGGSIQTGASTARFKLKVKGSAAVGSYPLTFTATDDAGQIHSASITLVLQ